MAEPTPRRPAPTRPAPTRVAATHPAPTAPAPTLPAPAGSTPGRSREQAALTAAQRYYLQDVTMAAIATELGTSRSSVSRLLAHARATGLVSIRVQAPGDWTDALSAPLHDRFGVTAHVVVVPERASGVDRLEQVAAAAAQVVGAHIDANVVLGVAWGSTMTAVSRHLPTRPVRGAQVVQLNGAGNMRTTGTEYASEILRRFEVAFGARAQEFPVPTFFDDPATKEAMWRERSTRHVLAVQAQLTLALFSVGSPFAEVPSHVYVGGYLDPADYRSLGADRVVGDVGTVFYREDGSTDGIALNARSTGPAFERLRRVSRRIGVVAGVEKVHALRGALAAGLITDLVLDDALAAALLQG